MRFEESVKHIEIAKKAVKSGLVSVSNLPPKFKRQSPNPKSQTPWISHTEVQIWKVTCKDY